MLTIEELEEIKYALEFGKHVDSYLDECEEALKIINREIELLEKQNSTIKTWLDRDDILYKKLSN
jgi:hypothetical protein